MRKLVKTLWLILILVSALATISSAQADLKSTNAVYAWDRTANNYQNSNVIIYWDGGWVPFIHELAFDNDLYTPTTPTCNGGSTEYGGRMEFGLYHTDNAPAGAKGFQATQNWRLVNCDRNGDGRFNNTDRALLPPSGFTTYENLAPIYQDVITPCTTGNCLNEIVTTLEVNLDKNCDGNIDAGVPTLVCFYAEASVPTTADTPYWGQQLQARISEGGGDKTVNFNPTAPTAITLVKLAAKSGVADFRNTLASAGVFAVLLVSLVGTTLWRRKKQI